MNQVILLTGPIDAARAAVAEAICERFDRMLHVPAETLRHWVRAGYRHPWLADDPQAAEQRLLAVRNASAIAREAIAMRYAVVIDDVIPAESVGPYREALASAGGSVHFALLLPATEPAAPRDGVPGGAGERLRALHEQFSRQSAEGLLPGAVIRTADGEDAALTADRVLDAVATGEALFVEQPA